MIKKITDSRELKLFLPLFNNSQDTLIQSAFQGCMGSVYGDIEQPATACVLTADFCFLAGEACLTMLEFVRTHLLEHFLIVLPVDEAWHPLVGEFFEKQASAFSRYAFKKDGDVFDRDQLQSYIHALPDGYTLKRINEDLYNYSLTQDWSEDLCSQFEDYKNFESQGVGFMVLYDDLPVCGASSYTFYNEGIEIEIDTYEPYRRRGLALACASKLILHCLENNLYPSWDAANLHSVALAEKLGYHFNYEYTAYYVEKTL
jgi:RimJ/RimL family protein N-acetyltransferase